MNILRRYLTFFTLSTIFCAVVYINTNQNEITNPKDTRAAELKIEKHFTKKKCEQVAQKQEKHTNITILRGINHAKFVSDLPDEPTILIEGKNIPKVLGKHLIEEEFPARFTEERLNYEHKLQVNPITGTIPLEEKELELKQALAAPKANYSEEKFAGFFAYRGPSNFGGRTRSLVFDAGDITGNTILAGGVSGGVFRTTNGGTSWTMVSDLNDRHNVTAIAQDPRPGFNNIWYYATGESAGNSASESGAFYLGFGVFQSTDNGLSWTQMSFPLANIETTFDRRFDLISRVQVHPTTGDLLVAALGRIYRFDASASNWITELTAVGGFNTAHFTDVVVTPGGRVYAVFSGVTPAATEGVWTSNDATGIGAGTWSRIATNGAPGAWNQTGRGVLAIAPSNPDILYVLYESAGSTPSPGDCDIWRWNQLTTTWTSFAAKIPDEPGGSAGNDPFNTQGGYDMAVSVKPDDQNFVVIGSTNAYKITDITSDPEFLRIGGYDGPSTFAIWNNGGGVEHHPDVHTLVFDPNNTNLLYSGTDGGVHRTINVNAATVGWVNLSNNYDTYQFYHVNMHPATGNNAVIGGAQDNGTMAGGTALGFPDNTTQSRVFSGDGAACAISNADPCLPFFMSTQNGNMVRDCPTFATITPGGSTSQFVTYFHLDPVGSNTIYYAGRGTAYRTNNATTVTTGTWNNLGTLPGTDFIQSYATTGGAYSAATSQLYIGGDEGHIFRLSDPRGAPNLGSLIDITPPGATVGFPSVVKGLAVHPTNPDIVLATYSNYGIPSIFLTTNATAGTPTWTLVEGNLSGHSVRSAAIAEVAGNIIYFVGTAKGLYSNQNPGVDNWLQEGSATVGYALVTDLKYRHSDLQLLIGTHGNGMYSATVDNIALPIQMISFEGECSNAQISIHWQTASENDNDYFSVERSIHGINYEVIGIVDGAGNSTSIHDYGFKDRNPFSQNTEGYFYRIKQTDHNGVYRRSASIYISSSCKMVEANLTISPNPSSGLFLVNSNLNIL